MCETKGIDESVEHAWDTTPVQVWVDVDRQIASLVVALNRLPRLRTFSSCAGHLRSKYEQRARVMFGFSGALDAEASRLIGRLNKRLSRLVPGGWRLERTPSGVVLVLWLDREAILAVTAAVETMNEQRCVNCRHWKRDFASNYGLDWPAGWNPCGRAPPAEYEPYGGTVTPQRGSLAVVTGIDETGLLLVTAPTFGCVMWEATDHG